MVKFFEGLPLFPSLCVLTPRAIALEECAPAHAGWVYGTVAPDGTVTSAGRVASCMGCHTPSAKHERLFGLPPAPKS
jgi:hypothetical protein